MSDVQPTSIRLTAEQIEKLVILKGWMRLESTAAVFRELLEMEFSKQALIRGEIDGPIFIGDLGGLAS